MAVAPPVWKKGMVIPYLSHGATTVPKAKAMFPNYPGVGTNAGYTPPTDPYRGFAPSIKLPGFTPDWAGALAKALEGGRFDRDRALGNIVGARQGAIRRAVIAAGFAPDAPIGDIDAATLQAARANEFSTLADLERGSARSSSSLLSRLAGRGTSRGGGAFAGEERIQEGRRRALDEAKRLLTEGIATTEAGAAEKEADVWATYRGLEEAAALRIQSDPTLQPIPEGSAILDPTSGKYMSPDGRWYTADGQPTTPPTQTQAPAQAPAQTPAPTTPKPQPSGVEWGGQMFYTKKALRSWLSARGVSYDTWAQNHQAAANRLA